MENPRRILVCGQREYTNYTVIHTMLATFPKGSTVIHGGARGADTLAGQAAKALGFDLLVFPAQWGKYGKAAGPVRNWQMLEEGKPDIVLAFYTKGGQATSKGTNDMVRQARKAGVPTIITIEQFGKP